MIPYADVINRYLDGLGATLWGRSFNINDDREEAIQFITKLWHDLEILEVELIAEMDLSALQELLVEVEDATR
jgi:hypothetical protein